MKNDALRAMLIDAGLKMLPPSVRASLLDDVQFMTESGLAATAWVKLGDDGPSFARPLLLCAFQTATDTPSTAVPLFDDSDQEWQLVARLEADEWRFSLEGHGRVFPVTDHSVLSSDPAIRLAWLERESALAGLPRENTDEWARNLEQQAPDAADFDRLLTDLEANPRAQLQALKAGFSRQRVNISQLVPQNRRYYERLVGEPQLTLGGYLEMSVPPVLDRYLGQGGAEGLMSALGIATSSLISQKIDLQLSASETRAAFEDIVTSGDPVPIIAALEVGLRVHADNPDLAQALQQLARRLLDFDPAAPSDPVALLSAMFVLVAGELARTKLLTGSPPYWVRQCAFSHATLIVKALLESKLDVAGFTGWAKGLGYGHLFFLQGLIDLRQEPRWLPDFVDANQLRAEFIGRAILVALSLEKEIPAGQLRDLLMAEDGELRSRLNFPFPFLPGPLDGAATLAPIPGDVLDEVKSALTAETLDSGSFTGLVNSALLYEISPDLAEFAAEALRRVKHNLDRPESSSSAFGMLSGLAIVAAATRGTALADEVRILTRVMRRRGQKYTVNNGELRIALVAAASHSTLDEWAKFAGDWLTELAFEVEDKSEATVLLTEIRRLVEFEPALAAKVATADAALASLL